MRTFFISLGCLAACSSPPEFGCGGPEDLCEVDGGRYLAVIPEGASAEDPLATFIHYHGHRGSANLLYDKASFTDPLIASGALGIYMDSIDGRWGFGDRDTGRDELEFFDAVLDDVIERFPVDREAIIVSGYSVGGSMAWDIACRGGSRQGVVYAPVSGAFWNPLPQDCPGGPVRLRHEHGTNDTTFPLEGRAVGGGERRQGDIRESVQVGRQTAGCTETSQVVEEDGRTCEVWSDCADGAQVQLCLHDGGHVVTEGWHERTIAWARGD